MTGLLKDVEISMQHKNHQPIRPDPIRLDKFNLTATWARSIIVRFASGYRLLNQSLVKLELTYNPLQPARTKSLVTIGQ